MSAVDQAVREGWLQPVERRPRLYVAGTISGDPRPFNVKKALFYDAADVLRARGYDTLVPLDVANDLCLYRDAEECGLHTGRKTAGVQQNAHSWECLLRNDLVHALQCDGVALIPGWEVSPGVRLEFATLTAVGVPARPVDAWEPVGQPGPPRTRVGVGPAGVYCARCGALEDGHAPGGSRFGCPFAGPGATSTCGRCDRFIVWSGRDWRGDSGKGDVDAVCRASTRPDVAHEPGTIVP